MKKICLLLSLLMFASITFFSAAYASEILSVAGNNYDITMYCMDNAGNYCDRNQLKTDEFIFESDGDFLIGSFEEEFFGLSSEGEYSETSIIFTGGFEAVDEDIEQYKFSFNGISLSDAVILGILEIEYYEFKFDFPDFGFELQEEATAYFIGLK